jgi:hypothetical protein
VRLLSKEALVHLPAPEVLVHLPVVSVRRPVVSQVGSARLRRVVLEAPLQVVLVRLQGRWLAPLRWVERCLHPRARSVTRRRSR